jgi:hypothetical protein
MMLDDGEAGSAAETGVETDGEPGTPASASESQIFSRLSDPSLFTGTHVHRFDPKTKKGRGQEGRAPTFDQVADLSLLTRSPANTPARSRSQRRRRKTASGGGRGGGGGGGGGGGAAKAKNAGPRGTKASASATASGDAAAASGDVSPTGSHRSSGGGSSLGQGSTIFDKLTDSRQYTGAHKHRFDKRTRQGRGLAGRDSIQKGAGHAARSALVNPDGAVHDLSQIVRPEFYGGKPHGGAAPAEGTPPPKKREFALPETDSGIFKKLTDPKQFTGSHKQR